MTGGKASPAPARPRHYSPSEFSAELEKAGLRYSEKWVRAEVAAGRIAVNPHFSGRLFIPEAELLRLVGIKEASA